MQKSHNSSGMIDCRPFIDFMLDVIENAMYQYVDSASDAEKNRNGGLSETEKEIISLIKENAHVRAFEMAQRLLKPVRTIENNLRQLKEKGVIIRIGSKKTGYWKIN